MTPTHTPHNSVYLYLMFALCFLGGVFGGVASTLMSAYLPVVLKELTSGAEQSDTDRIGAIINAAYLFGMMFGGILTGFFSDRFGRKIAAALSIACLGLFTLLTAFAQDWQTVVALRFMTGFGTGSVLLTSAVMIAEEWPERNRGVALGILSITIPVGIFSAGLITYNISSWRSGFLIGIAPLAIAALGYVVFEESERWKQDKAKIQSVTSPKMSIFHASVSRDLLLGSVIYGSMLIGLWAVFSWLPSWVQTLVQDSDGQKERGLSMILFATGGLTGGFISGWVSRMFGVKRTMLVCFAATFTLTFLLFKLNTNLSIVAYAEMAMIALFFGMSQGVLNGYVPELFPTAVRSAATGFCFNVGRVFTASVVFFIGWLEVAMGGFGNALFAFSFVFLIGLVAAFFAKEKNLISDEL
ncbi:MAG: MFS transporter [Saprospiraceae bacterium]|nr:MFS transporter [Saprospiraceae bacterium]